MEWLAAKGADALEALTGATEMNGRPGEGDSMSERTLSLNDAAIHMGWSRRTLTRALDRHGIATIGTGKKLVGKDAVAECDKLIKDLEKLHADLKALEEESRTMPSPAQQELALEPLVMPSRQGDVQAASTATQARQQPAAQSLPQQQQPSDQ